MHSVRLEPTKLILIGTRTTYQATGEAYIYTYHTLKSDPLRSLLFVYRYLLDIDSRSKSNPSIHSDIRGPLPRGRSCYLSEMYSSSTTHPVLHPPRGRGSATAILHNTTAVPNKLNADGQKALFNVKNRRTRRTRCDLLFLHVFLFFFFFFCRILVNFSPFFLLVSFFLSEGEGRRQQWQHGHRCRRQQEGDHTDRWQGSYYCCTCSCGRKPSMLCC